MTSLAGASLPPGTQGGAQEFLLRVVLEGEPMSSRH